MYFCTCHSCYHTIIAAFLCSYLLTIFIMNILLNYPHYDNSYVWWLILFISPYVYAILFLFVLFFFCHFVTESNTDKIIISIIISIINTPITLLLLLISIEHILMSLNLIPYSQQFVTIHLHQYYYTALSSDWGGCFFLLLSLII